MLVTIDKSALSVEQKGYPLIDNLGGFVEEVAKANPLFSYACDPTCVYKIWDRELDNGSGGKGMYRHIINRVKVYQDGEHLGGLMVTERYRRSVGMELVYGVESFRISKERGRHDATFTKDIKIALRTVKKMMVVRGSQELFNHIYSSVSQKMVDHRNTMRNSVRYALDIQSEAMNYARAAYDAHKQGKATVEMPVKLASVRDYDKYLATCAELDVIANMCDKFSNKEGVPVKVLPDGKILCANLLDGSVMRYASFDELPENMKNAMAMFKVINELEPYDHLGIKLSDGFFFLV